MNLFLGVAGDWGGVWEINVPAITGFPMFDYFFTMQLTFGILAMMCGWLFNIMTRS